MENYEDTVDMSHMYIPKNEDMEYEYLLYFITSDYTVAEFFSRWDTHEEALQALKYVKNHPKNKDVTNLDDRLLIIKVEKR